MYIRGALYYGIPLAYTATITPAALPKCYLDEIVENRSDGRDWYMIKYTDSIGSGYVRDELPKKNHDVSGAAKEEERRSQINPERAQSFLSA